MSRDPATTFSGPRTALTEAQIFAVKREHARGASPQALADRYGVSKRTVYRYLAMRVWVSIELADGAFLAFCTERPIDAAAEAALRELGQAALASMRSVPT